MEIIEAISFYISLFFYLFSCIYGFISHFYLKKIYEKRIYFFTIFGFLFHFLTFILRWINSKHIPTIGNYENIITGTLFLVLFILIFLRGRDKILGFLFSLSLNIILMGFVFAVPKDLRTFVASLKSFWLYIHIIFAWLSYGAFTISAGVAIAYLIKKEENIKLEELMFKSTAFGLVMDGLMIMAGSIWAKALWGSFWSWDPVETWSLVSFLLYGLILHLKITLKIKSEIFAYLLIFSLITVLISFWGVNFFMEKSYHIFNVE